MSKTITETPTATWRERIHNTRMSDAEHSVIEGEARAWRTCAVGQALRLDYYNDAEITAGFDSESMFALRMAAQSFAARVSELDWKGARASLDTIDALIEWNGGAAICRRRLSAAAWGSVVRRHMADARRAISSLALSAPAEPEAEAVRAEAELDAIRARLDELAPRAAAYTSMQARRERAKVPTPDEPAHRTTADELIAAADEIADAATAAEARLDGND